MRCSDEAVGRKSCSRAINKATEEIVEEEEYFVFPRVKSKTFFFCKNESTISHDE